MDMPQVVVQQDPEPNRFVSVGYVDVDGLEGSQGDSVEEHMDQGEGGGAGRDRRL